MVHEISSPHNSKYRRWLSLLDAKGIHKEGLALISGSKLVNELCAQQPDWVEEILLPPKAPLHTGGFRQTRLTAPLFKALDSAGTHLPLAVMRTPQIADWDSQSPPQGLELILALSDPSNLGACLRSAEAFGVTRAILTQECASPFLPKAVRASSGSCFRLPLARTGPLAQIQCPNAAGLDMAGESLDTFKWPKNVYLVLGNEGQGLPPGLLSSTIRIPMREPVESLNATVAAAVAMYSYYGTWRTSDETGIP